MEKRLDRASPALGRMGGTSRALASIAPVPPARATIAKQYRNVAEKVKGAYDTDWIGAETERAGPPCDARVGPPGHQFSNTDTFGFRFAAFIGIFEAVLLLVVSSPRCRARAPGGLAKGWRESRGTLAGREHGRRASHLGAI
jgi:hypothetical protein